MRVLFVYTVNGPETNGKPISSIVDFSHSISLLSSALKKNNHETRLYILTRNSSFSDLDKFIDEFSPELFCFSSVTSEFQFVTKISLHLKKKYPNVFRIIGGPHVTLMQTEEMLDIFNFLCLGEGDNALPAVVKELEHGRLPLHVNNIWLRDPSGNVVKNPLDNFIEDLDAIPYPDHEIWKDWIAFESRPLRVSILVGRGCPFDCTYCCNHAFKKITHGKYVRLRSVENILGELQCLMDYYPDLKDIYFEVETICANMNWALGFCQALRDFNAKHKFRFTFGANLRVTPSFKKHARSLFTAMKDAGFRQVSIGVESGSPRVRGEILNRFYDNEDIVACAEEAHAAGIHVYCNIMIGLPTETIADFNMTVDLMRKVKPEQTRTAIFYPYPGTTIYNFCIKNGYIKSIVDTKKERMQTCIGYSSFSKQQIQKAYLWFFYYFTEGRRSKASVVEPTLNRYLEAYQGKLDTLLVGFYVLIDAYSPFRKLRAGTGEKEIGRLAFLKYYKELFAKIPGWLRHQA